MVINPADQKGLQRELFGAGKQFFNRLHSYVVSVVAIGPVRAHSEFKRVSRPPPEPHKPGGFSTRIHRKWIFSEKGVSL
jgi:hypothetical protein